MVAWCQLATGNTDNGRDVVVWWLGRVVAWTCDGMRQSVAACFTEQTSLTHFTQPDRKYGQYMIMAGRVYSVQSTHLQTWTQTRAVLAHLKTQLPTYTNFTYPKIFWAKHYFLWALVNLLTILKRELLVIVLFVCSWSKWICPCIWLCIHGFSWISHSRIPPKPNWRKPIFWKWPWNIFVIYRDSSMPVSTS